MERRYGKPIAELLDRGVIAPLGMTSTVVPERGADDRAIMSAALLQRAVQGYGRDGEVNDFRIYMDITPVLGMNSPMGDPTEGKEIDFP